MATRALKRATTPHDVLVFRDGAEVLDWLSALQSNPSLNRKDLPALILLDHRVPKVSGPEVLTSIRADERFATVPIVMLSSMAEIRELTPYYIAGANSVVQKGMELDVLTKNLAAAVDYWLSINQAGT